MATLAGCAGPRSTLDPAGPAASTIATLWWVLLVGAALLFLLVMVLFVIVMMRPGWARKVSPARWIVLGGLVLPAIVLTPLVVYALMTGERLLPRSADNPLRIEAEAEQWHWNFTYPSAGGVKTEGVLHLPAGRPIDVVVTSLDVIHAFWIPRLAGKIDAIPGHANVLRIEADQPGTYEGLCNEFCGKGHSGMRFDVIVHPAAAYDAALVAPDLAGRIAR
ncbi:cytochrome c oxidase subunit 2 [Kaistia soli DSM 19436]|uniref:Cytochrome aa3 subunit 2 n=1 Tax=Kaistia soli DSM 19436 TaxID=1122133 RepID=A0A1M5E576_9HYPH|nr:cytochrome c oxidase subunit II [Kaistia soli]SHF74221.1 cytochrome c oxidase subunit 2 [Kaistia soli DSM 19436]